MCSDQSTKLTLLSCTKLLAGGSSRSSSSQLKHAAQQTLSLLCLILCAAGSDSYTTKCIWRGGFGMTDPGWSYFEKDVLAHFTFDRWTFRVGDSPCRFLM